jgi:hypothetical protein
MNIFFDMDYTLLGVDGSLRPGAREVMERLSGDGHALYIWSGNGIRWLEVRRHGLEHLVSDCFEKPMDGYADAVELLGPQTRPDLVVDDHLEVPAALGGVWVRPYYFRDEADDEMERVYDIICEWVREGRSDAPRFRAPPRQRALGDDSK